MNPYFELEIGIVMATHESKRSGRRRPELDEIDRRIVMLLARDARLSVRAIARQVGMSPGAISERVDRLERDGVIAGYHAWINRSALGYPITALVGIQMDHGNTEFEQSLDRLMEVDQVQRIQIVTGDWDLLIEVSVRDHDELRDVLLNHLWSIPGFRHSQTLVVLGVRDRPGFLMSDVGEEALGT